MALCLALPSRLSTRLQLWMPLLLSGVRPAMCGVTSKSRMLRAAASRTGRTVIWTH